MESTTTRLLLEITECPVILEAVGGGHPCSQVVGAQGASLGEPRQVPEPWNGHLETAPVLFVSSNPAISGEEVYPEATWEAGDHARARGGWPEERRTEYFNGRFDATASHDSWIKGGSRTRLPDGSYSRSVPFLAAVRNRAAELFDGVLERPVIPGTDYCLTEVVHCKSPGERGARAASATCADRFLHRVLACSSARVIVAFGDIAGTSLRNQPGSGIATCAIYTVAEATLGGRRRIVAFLPHPNRRGKRKKLSALRESDQARLKVALLDSSAP